MNFKEMKTWNPASSSISELIVANPAVTSTPGLGFLINAFEIGILSAENTIDGIKINNKLSFVLR